MQAKRTKRIVIRTSIEEHADLALKAKAAGITVSALVREHLDRLRVYNHADREAWLRAVTALHQAAATMSRASLALKTADAAAALAYLAAANRQLGELLTRVPNHAREVLPSRGRGG